MKHYEVIIVGGGPAGLAAAAGAYERGARRIVLLERDAFLGGILNQCIHSGFGLHMFRQELTGPEYAQRYIEKIAGMDIDCRTDTTVIRVTPQRTVTAVNAKQGLLQFSADAVVIACGCRERPRGAVDIAGMRGAGIYTAGAAQKYANLYGYLVGRNVVIFGSGDIGLIMARRMKFEGAHVCAVIERKPYSSGLTRNIVQCLHDYDIPLLYNHTILCVNGADRVKSVTVAQVENRIPQKGTEREIACDTLLLSVGLLPENELSIRAGIKLSASSGGAVTDERLMTSVEGIFCCGNVLHVHDIVDYVSQEAALAGSNAAAYAQGRLYQNHSRTEIICGEGVKYTVPHCIGSGAAGPVTLKFRSKAIYRKARIKLYAGAEQIAEKTKRIITPSEMQTIELTPQLVSRMADAEAVMLAIEEG